MASVPRSIASSWGGAAPAWPLAIRTAPIATMSEGQRHEQVRRDREDVPGLAEAAQVRDRDQRDRHQADRDAHRVELRRDRDQLLHGGRRGHRHRHHVVDQERRGRDEAEERRELLAGDGVRAAAVGERPADLAVRDRDDGEHDGDRRRHLDRGDEGERAGDDEDPQDLLGRIGGRRDRVGAEDREREPLRQPLADLLLGGQGAADEPRLRAAEARVRAAVRGSGRLAASRPAGWGRCSGSRPRAAARRGRADRPACGR